MSARHEAVHQLILREDFFKQMNDNDSVEHVEGAICIEGSRLLILLTFEHDDVFLEYTDDIDNRFRVVRPSQYTVAADGLTFKVEYLDEADADGFVTMDIFAIQTEIRWEI